MPSEDQQVNPLSGGVVRPSDSETEYYQDSPFQLSTPGVSIAQMNAGLSPPAFDQLARDYGTSDVYNIRVSDADVVRMLRLEGIAWAISEIWARAVGGKPPTVRDDVKGRLAEQINKKAAELDFWSVHQWWYRQQRDRAVALLSLGWADNMIGGELALAPPATVGDIEFIQVITRDMIVDPGGAPGGEDGICEGTAIGTEDYGNILHYWLKLPSGTSKTPSPPKKIHPDRLVHMCHASPDGSKYGMSQFLPLWNVLQGKQQMDQALWRTVRRMASKIPVVTNPRNATKEQKANVDKAIKYLDAGSTLRLDEGWSFRLEGTADALNPKAYVDYAMDLISASGPGSKTVLFGNAAGKLTGSDINERLFYSRATDEQRNKYGPKAKEVWDRIRAKGIIKGEGNYWLEFDAIKEETESEKAELEYKLAQTLELRVRTIAQATGATFTTETDEDGTIRLVSDDKTISISMPGLNTETSKAKKNAYAGYLPFKDQQALYKKWKLHTDQAEDEFLDGLNRGFRDFKTSFNDQFRETWEAEVGEIDIETSIGLNVEDPPARPYSQDQELAVVKTMRKWDHHYPGFEDEMALGLEMAYKVETAATLSLWSPPKTKGAVTDAGAIKVLREEGRELAEETVLSGKRRAMRAIRQGLQAGEGYSKISERIGAAYKMDSKNFPATAQKVVHEAMANARWDTLEAHGEHRGAWLSAGDDNVREDPVSHRLDGMILTREQSMEPDMLPAYGCRCSFIPLSAYEEAVAAVDELEEMVANA